MSIKQMDITPEIAAALANLRLIAQAAGTSIRLRNAINTLDDARVFAEIDERYEYAAPADVLQEIAQATIPNTLDPAEWGDTTSADVALRSGLTIADLPFVSCDCGLPDETSPALHAGTCPVWAKHHNLNR